MFKYTVILKAMKRKQIGLKKLTLLLTTVQAAVLVLGGVVPLVKANSNDQIQQLQQENANNRNIVAQLQAQAVSYQDAIAQLQAQIDTVQAQININTARQTEIQNSIIANEQELARQRSVLGENIKVMYLEGQISTIEILATSKNLSEFVDKEEYRTIIKNKIQETLKRIAQLQNELKEQKVQVERLLAEQQSQRAQLANARAAQSAMLAYNQSQQNDYNQLTRNNQAKIDALIAAQRRANNSTDGGYYFLRFPGNVRSFDGSNYLWRDAGFSMQLGPCSFNDSYPDSPDGWGYCTRQCVSYAAWAVGASGRNIPMYYGNARDWVAAAQNAGIPVYRTPQAGDIAISTSGQWGHAMYVEEVISSNRMLVSQYNASLNGEYSKVSRNY